MFEPIIEHSFIALFLLSIITFFEIMVNFRRPVVLKILLLSMTFFIGFGSAGNLYCLTHGYNRWLLEFPNTILAISAFLFYSLLINHLIKPLFLWIAIGTIFLQLFIYLIYSLSFGLNSNVNLLENQDSRLFIFTVRGIISTYFAFLVLDLYLKIKRKYASDNIYFKKIKKWSIFCILAISIQFPNKLFKVLGVIDTKTFLFFLISTYLMVLLFILFRPKFLNQTNLKITLSQIFSRHDRGSISINEFEIQFYNQLFYLNSKASPEIFAKSIEVSKEQLNEFILRHYQTNFTDLVNKARVDYFMSLIYESQHTKYTIETLAELSGFGSRQSLYTQFKKFHGGSPSDLFNSTLH